MKKFLATLLAIVTVLSLCACGKKDDGKITLKMWCIATESDSNRKSYENAIKDMAAKYPDITLEWDAIENEAYKTKIKTAVSGDNMPDIFFTWSCAFLGDFVSAGKVYCLDEAYKDFASKLPEKMCKNTTYDGKKYGVPLTMNIVGLFANMELLKKAGYDEIPGTYEEFIKCCDALKAQGIIPFGCAGKETWCVTEYLESVIEKSCGAQVLDDIFMGRAS
ncbi:MAG: extracellular solute-binding protein, partial [Lachnospiraceae bacterium]|nr:extracellular solute-binding protein [Lachnospiraceae bacterium]